MNNISIKECRVSNFRPTKFGINITLQIKEEDITKQEKDLLEDLRKSGESLVAVLQQFQKQVPIGEKLLEQLCILMDQYSKKKNIDIKILKEEIYKKYLIQSRKDLTVEQLRDIIRSYRLFMDEEKYTQN